VRNATNKTIAVVGVTSSGKSDLAVDIARFIKKNADRFGVSGAEIISVDSRQVYKGFNLVSGKITRKEMGGIPHHLLDIASPKRTYTVARFQRDAKKVTGDILKRGAVPILAGGTGLYLDAILYETSFPSVRPNSSLRKRLEKKSIEELYKELVKIDSQRARSIDRHNKRRIIRALEIVMGTGKPIPQTHPRPAYDSLIIGIDIPKDAVKKKMVTRIQARLTQGMIREVRALRALGISWKRLESFGLELKWISLFLQKKIDKDTMIKSLKKDTARYAKRQMTWFKRNKDIRWIPTKKLAHDARAAVSSFLLSNS